MARNGYRIGKAQVNLVVDPELRDRMRRKADRNGRTMSQEWLLAAAAWLGEEVPDVDAGVDSRRGVRAAAEGSGSGCDSRVAGGLPAGVVAHAIPASLIADSDVPVDDSRVPDWDALLAKGREAKGDTIRDTVSRPDWMDPLGEIA